MINFEPGAYKSTGGSATLRDGERPLSRTFEAQRLAKTAMQEAVAETDEPIDSNKRTSLNSYTKHSTPTQNNRSMPGWRPKSLRKTTFFTFASVFIVCIATLAGLFAYSRSHQGLLTV